MQVLVTTRPTTANPFLRRRNRPALPSRLPPHRRPLPRPHLAPTASATRWPTNSTRLRKTPCPEPDLRRSTEFIPPSSVGSRNSRHEFPDPFHVAGTERWASSAAR